jgi:hypothetical protein
MYSRSPAGDVLRSSVFMKLGHWHVYKQANMLVWSAYGHLFMAPLFHFMFPGGHAVKKPRLITIESFFTYIALSYPTWSDKLAALLKDVNVMPVMRSFAIQLRDLVEVFIPLVSRVLC